MGRDSDSDIKPSGYQIVSSTTSGWVYAFDKNAPIKVRWMIVNPSRMITRYFATQAEARKSVMDENIERFKGMFGDPEEASKHQ